MGPGPTDNGQVEKISPNNDVSGAISAIAASPTNADVVYIGSVNGGVWKSTNATSQLPHWTPLTDTQVSQSINVLQFDAANANTLLAGFGQSSALEGVGGPLSGIIRTTDGGATWKVLNGTLSTGPQSTLNGKTLSNAGLIITGIAANGQTIVFSDIRIVPDGSGNDSVSCGDSGAFRSTDGGQTFTQISCCGGLKPQSPTGLPGGPVLALAQDPLIPTTLYAASMNLSCNDGTFFNGIFKSEDSGASWGPVLQTEPQDAFLALPSTTSNVKIAVGMHNDVSVAVETGTKDYLNHPTDGQLHGVFHSSDGGSTWFPLDLPQTTEQCAAFGINPSNQGNVDLALANDPANANLVYIGGDSQPAGNEGCASGGTAFPNSIGATAFSGRLFQINAGGISGSQARPITNENTASNSSPHSDSRALTFDAMGNLLLGCDGGIFRRPMPNDITDWVSANGDLQITELYTLAYDRISHIIFGGSQDNGAQNQEGQNNTTWTDVIIPTQQGNAFIQGDGGDASIDATSTPGYSIRYESNTALSFFVRLTYNAANNITAGITPALKVVSGPALMPEAVSPVRVNNISPKRILIAALSGLYESTDQGDSLTQISNHVIGDGQGHGPLVYGGAPAGVNNPDLVYAGIGKQMFSRTTSGGGLNQLVSYPGTSVVLDVAIDPSDGNSVYVVDAGHVFYSPNGGGSWADITGNLGNPGAIDSVAVYQSSQGNSVVVGTYTGVLHRRGAHAHAPAQRGEHVGDLLGEFPGRHQDQRAGRLLLPRALPGCQPGEQRQAEGERLARPGLRPAENAAPGQRVGQHPGLDREWFADAARGQRADQPVVDAERAERGRIRLRYRGRGGQGLVERRVRIRTPRRVGTRGGRAAEPYWRAAGPRRGFRDRRYGKKTCADAGRPGMLELHRGSGSRHVLRRPRQHRTAV